MNVQLAIILLFGIVIVLLLYYIIETRKELTEAQNNYQKLVFSHIEIKQKLKTEVLRLQKVLTLASSVNLAKIKAIDIETEKAHTAFKHSSRAGTRVLDPQIKSNRAKKAKILFLLSESSGLNYPVAITDYLNYLKQSAEKKVPLKCLGKEVYVD